MIKRLICVVGAFFLAVTFSQAPEYTQQYNQRLAGAVDELSAIIAQFDADARQFGLSREDALDRYEQSPDDFLVRRGLSMQAVLARHDLLSAQLEQLRGAGTAERLMSLTRYFDTDVGRAALEDYTPAVPFTIEGMLLALGGWVAGYALAWCGTTTAAAPFRRRRSKVRISR